MIAIALPTRAAAPSAMRAAPVRSGASSGCEWLIPSGKSATAEPFASASCTARKVSSFFSVSAGSS